MPIVRRSHDSDMRVSAHVPASMPRLEAGTSSQSWRVSHCRQ